MQLPALQNCENKMRGGKINESNTHWVLNELVEG